MPRVRAQAVDEEPARRTQIALAGLFGLLVAALGATAAAIGSGVLG